ncbi:50S ribosomal protein L5 [Candidatus Berkelbacteria bacterium CG06_land_8_20_14_3_00_43_10]|uniref:Large ribosomal subunit protein uL5 n=1 Tax=Candidatus Berkelbacteria bacterium CG10_big_fil_rev_8_21_14_0_10_43_14 TaxID=1974515 RepID=A0A2M6R8U4_9BACT|nr:MAG: 50S ribosomal protein L5 [Candidatus Berkelbacteria bacterium CG10_big_fil_rev_8_21_14_0_10_43_14]PIU87402.1 MAG: 50S ribosomal protein L5 [Candidatus Berkelbacteria bacterium CG06_land_8_20_14_3_00_43_10]
MQEMRRIDMKTVEKNTISEYIDNAVKNTATTLGIKNVMAYPTISKIVLNIGFGHDKGNNQLIHSLTQDLSFLSGQKPCITRAKKSIASFKLRQGEPIGLKTTLRGKRMYNFLYKLIHTTLPAIRDFRGISAHSMDAAGNYTIGLHDMSVFPEISFSKERISHGVEVCIVLSNATSKSAHILYTELGFPFVKEPHG